MSSFIGHSLIGFSISRLKSKKIGWAIYFMFLACLPDMEYILEWIFGYKAEMRWGHSIFFIMVALLVCALFLKILKVQPFKLLVGLTALSLLSHLILDYFVGVYHNPLLYPLISTGFASPIGLLPSAGKLDLDNYYFWRNLIIELGILLPIVLSIRIYLKRAVIRRPYLKALLILMISIPFLIWSISLSR